MKPELFISRGIFFFARARAYIVIAAILTAASRASAAPVKAIQDLQNPDMKTKYAALQALTTSYSPETVDALASAAVHEKDTNFRLTVLDQLAALGNRRAIAPLAPLLKDKTVAIRQRAARVIAMLGGPAAEKALLQALKTERHPDIQAALLQGLSLCGSAESLADIQSKLHDVQPSVRANAEHAADRIRNGSRKVKESK